MDFESIGKGFIDFLQLDAKSFPLMVLEAKIQAVMDRVLGVCKRE